MLAAFTQTTIHRCVAFTCFVAKTITVEAYHKGALVRFVVRAVASSTSGRLPIVIEADLEATKT